jgi:hypothetical protein
MQPGFFNMDELLDRSRLVPVGTGEFLCKKCGIQTDGVETIEADTIHYARLTCSHCGRWIKWVPKPRD